MGKIKNKIFTWTWGTVTVISSFSPTTSSAGLEVSTEAGLKSSMITANIVHVSFTNKLKKLLFYWHTKMNHQPVLKI